MMEGWPSWAEKEMVELSERREMAELSEEREREMAELSRRCTNISEREAIGISTHDK